jgi:thioredoxin-related protein
MKKALFLLTSYALLTLVPVFVQGQSEPDKKEGVQLQQMNEPFDSSIYYTDTLIQWLSIDEAMQLQKKEPKKIFLNVYVTWCRWCKQMKDSIFTNREIAHYLNQNFYPVRFNAEQKESLTFKGREYKFINEGDYHVHEFSLFLLNYRQSYPGFVFFNEEGNVINVRTSAMDVYLTEAVLNYYGSNAYQSTPFPKFEEDFMGKIP